MLCFLRNEKGDCFIALGSLLHFKFYLTTLHKFLFFKPNETIFASLGT